MSELTEKIVQAIVLADRVAMQDEISPGVKAIYDTLEEKVGFYVQGSEDAEFALQYLKKNPRSQARRAFLEEELDKLDAGENKELVELSKKVLRALGQDTSLESIVEVSEVKGKIVGISIGNVGGGSVISGSDVEL